MGRATKDTKILDEAVLRNFPARQRYLIGVSGGRDSVALLHSLGEIGYRKLIVCHLNHRLRGRSAEVDARFVRQLAETHDFQFEIGVADVRKAAAKQKLSIETAARIARYEFFAAVARRQRCPRIFLGHHADDLVETFLMNLFRGTGNEGLGAIRKVSVRDGLTIIRPLVETWRDEIDRYIAGHHLKFREDATNESLKPTRNRFRHRIIPFLEKEFGRGIRKSIWRAATIAADEEEWLASLIPEISPQLSATVLRKKPIAWQRRVLRDWLRQHAVRDISFDLIERVRVLIDPENGVAKTNLPGNRFARRREKKIFLEGPTRKQRRRT